MKKIEQQKMVFVLIFVFSVMSFGKGIGLIGEKNILLVLIMVLAGLGGVIFSLLAYFRVKQ